MKKIKGGDMKIKVSEIKEKIKNGNPKPYYGDLGYSYQSAFAVEDEDYYYVEVKHFNGAVEYEVVSKDENAFIEIVFLE